MTRSDAFLPVAIAGAVVLAALLIAALSYMRAVNALASFTREKKRSLVQENRPPDWDRGLYILPEDIHPRDLFFWVSRVVLGTQALDIRDEAYRALLWTARRRLLVCLILFMIFLIGLGWMTKAP